MIIQYVLIKINPIGYVFCGAEPWRLKHGAVHHWRNSGPVHMGGDAIEKVEEIL